MKSKKILLTLLVGGTLLGSGCFNTLTSINLCGTVFPWCSPTDQINLFYPVLNTPDYNTDPSCTTPLGCSDSDIYQNTDGFPGGSGSNAPTEDRRGFSGGGG